MGRTATDCRTFVIRREGGGFVSCVCTHALYDISLLVLGRAGRISSISRTGFYRQKTRWHL